jgi:hypothetical protein
MVPGIKKEDLTLRFVSGFAFGLVFKAVNCQQGKRRPHAFTFMIAYLLLSPLA